jgi:hypothetical protein
MTYLLNGLEKQYPSMVEMSRHQVHTNAITYNGLIEAVDHLASRESTKLAMAAPRQQSRTPSPSRDYCSTCKSTHFSNLPLHQACGKHHNGGDDKCWKLHPELRDEFKTKRANKFTPTTVSDNANASMTTSRQQGVIGLAISCVAFSEDKLTKDTIIGDSGASSHTFNHRKWFTELEKLDKPYSTAASNGGKATTVYAGKVQVKIRRSDGSHTLLRVGAYYVPDSPVNIISDGQLRRDGCVFNGTSDKDIVKATGAELAQVNWISNVKVFTTVEIPPTDLLDDPQVEIGDISCPIVDESTEDDEIGAKVVGFKSLQAKPPSSPSSRPPDTPKMPLRADTYLPTPVPTLHSDLESQTEEEVPQETFHGTEEIDLQQELQRVDEEDNFQPFDTEPEPAQPQKRLRPSLGHYKKLASGNFTAIVASSGVRQPHANSTVTHVDSLTLQRSRIRATKSPFPFSRQS